MNIGRCEKHEMTGKIWLEANTYSNRGRSPRKSNGHAAPACLEGSTGEFPGQQYKIILLSGKIGLTALLLSKVSSHL